MQSERVTGELSVRAIVKRLVNVSRRVRSGIGDIHYNSYIFAISVASAMMRATCRHINRVYFCLISCAGAFAADERTRKPRYKSHILVSVVSHLRDFCNSATALWFGSLSYRRV